VNRRLMMGPVIHDLSFRALQADALFVSGLQRCDEPSVGQVRQAIADTIRVFGYSGCAGWVAQEFGDHPETAAARMRWAHAVAGEAFAESVPEPGPGVDAVGLPVVHPQLPGQRASGSPCAERRESAGSLAGGPG